MRARPPPSARSYRIRTALLVHLDPNGGVRLESHPVQDHREFLHHDDLPLLEGVPPPRPCSRRAPAPP